VLNPECHVGEKIINQCIKTIEYSFEIMDIDSNEKYVENLNTCLNEVGVGYFLNKRNSPRPLNHQCFKTSTSISLLLSEYILSYPSKNSLRHSIIIHKK
jgi:hypothetical protein